MKHQVQIKDRNLKILQVIDTLNIGGGEKVFVDVCNILYDNNISISCFFLLESGDLREELNENIPIIELNRTNKWSLIKMYRCSKILKQHDIVHCHFRSVYKYIFIVSRLFNIKVKIILHDHYGSIDIDKRIPFLFNSYFKPDSYIGVSSTLKEWAINSLKIKTDKIFVLENIVSKSLQKENYRKQFDLILVSNIKPVKNNKFGLEIIENLDASLLLLGQNQNNSYYNEICNQKSNYNLKCEIDTSIKNVQPILHYFKLGLHTSVSESGPLVLIEYLAQGLPFLAYETGEVARILKPYFPDYFIDNFEIDNWTGRIKMLLSKEVDTEKMHAVFTKYFGSEQYFKKLMTIYQCIKN